MTDTFPIFKDMNDRAQLLREFGALTHLDRKDLDDYFLNAQAPTASGIDDQGYSGYVISQDGALEKTVKAFAQLKDGSFCTYAVPVQQDQNARIWHPLVGSNKRILLGQQGFGMLDAGLLTANYQEAVQPADIGHQRGNSTTERTEVEVYRSLDAGNNVLVGYQWTTSECNYLLLAKSRPIATGVAARVKKVLNGEWP